MTARAEERARLRNALDTCRREARYVEEWNRAASVWRKHGGAFAEERCRGYAASAAIHAERAARAYFKGR